MLMKSLVVLLLFEMAVSKKEPDEDKGTWRRPPMEEEFILGRIIPQHMNRNYRDLSRQQYPEETGKIKDEGVDNELGPFEVNRIYNGDLEATVLLEDGPSENDSPLLERSRRTRRHPRDLRQDGPKRCGGALAPCKPV